MLKATVTVKDFWLPEGKKRWVLKTERDQLFGVPEKLAGYINKGGTYDLGYKEDHWNGKTYLVVETAFPASGSQPQQTRSYASPAPSPYSPSPKPYDEKGEDIAVMTLIKGWIERIPVGDTGALTHALNSARDAWLKHKKHFASQDKIESGRPTAREEMDDEIPH